MRSVSLYLLPDVPINYIQLSFVFSSNSKIDWVLISEVDLETADFSHFDLLTNPVVFQDDGIHVISLGPVNPPPSISLSCTAINEGSFAWEWTRHGAGDLLQTAADHRIWSADASRTSIMDINRLTKANSTGNYTCHITRQNSNAITRYSKTFTLSLNTAIEVRYTIEESTKTITIICEVYGYLLDEDIKYMRHSQLITPVGGKYTLLYMEGEKGSVGSNNGGLRGSQIAQLKIENVQESDYGSYSCVTHEEVAEIMIVHSTLTPSVTSKPSILTHVITYSPTNELSSISSTNNSTIAIAITVCVMAVVGLIAIIALILLVVIRKKRRMQGDNSGDSKRERYQPSNNCAHPEDEPVYSIITKKGVSSSDSHQYYQNTPADTTRACPAPPPRTIVPPEQSRNSCENFNSSTTQLLPYQGCSLNGFVKPDTLISPDTLTQPHYASPRIPGTGCKVSSLYMNNHGNQGLYVNEGFNESNNLDEDGYDHLHPMQLVEPQDNGGPLYEDLKPLTGASKTESISYSNIHELSVIECGELASEVIVAEMFGYKVRKDGWLQPCDSGVKEGIKVAVKKLKASNQDKQSREAFEKEMRFMSRLDHQNVVKLLAINESGREPVFMVLEYMANGDLHQFLLKHHHVSQNHHGSEAGYLSPQHLLSMSIQIANGLTYLASHNYIHRDMATRNCLVGEDSIVKIADFGLSRNLYNSIYYRVKGKAKMPIRWMATECFYGKFSQFSDVWAYGVTVWEIYTLAREQPFSAYSDLEVISDAMRGEDRQQLYKPRPCPKEVYDVLKKSCFKADYTQRAVFSTIHEQLIETYKQLYQ